MPRLFTSFLLLFLGYSFAFAQERIIDEATYKQEMRSAGEYRLNENYRVKTSTTSSRSGPVTMEIHEYEVPGPKRRIRIFRIDRNETDPSSEWIFIGEKMYVKRPGLDWQVEELKQAPIVTPSELPKVEYKDLGIEPKGSIKCLQRTVRSQLTYGGESFENVQVVKSWIDRSGRLRKEEYTSTNSRTGSTVLTMEYEVDPTIRIEAPIKTPQ